MTASDRVRLFVDRRVAAAISASRESETSAVVSSTGRMWRSRLLFLSLKEPYKVDVTSCGDTAHKANGMASLDHGLRKE